MKVFYNYSQYYDLLYKEKNYKKESEFIIKLLKEYSQVKVKNIINIGCGTGAHDVNFIKQGYNVLGIDQSEIMLKIAEEKKENLFSAELRKKIEFKKSDIRNFRTSQKFDAAVSLFHVLSYQIKNDDVKKYFKNILKVLKKRSIFIFDFWYGPGVLTDAPKVSIKKAENENLIIERKARPVIHADINTVDVNYEVKIFDKKILKTQTIKECHRMRYFFKPELEFILKMLNLKILSFINLPYNKKVPDINSWNAGIIAQK